MLRHQQEISRAVWGISPYPPELMIEIAAISEIPRSRFRQPERGDQVLREWPLTPNVPL